MRGGAAGPRAPPRGALTRKKINHNCYQLTLQHRCPPASVCAHSQAEPPASGDAVSTVNTSPPPPDGRAWAARCPPRTGLLPAGHAGHAEPPSPEQEGRPGPWRRTPALPPGRQPRLSRLQARGAAAESQVCRIITTTCQDLLLRYFTPEICYIKGH